MREWLPERHLAYHIGDLVVGPDLTALYAPYGSRMMVKVPPSGYATGVFPSRGYCGEAGGGRGVSGVGGRGTSRATARFASSVVGIRRTSRGGSREVVRVAHDGFGAVREAVGGRDQGAGERGQTQGGGLRPDASEEAGVEAGIGTLPNRARDTDAQEDERFREAFRGDGLPEELRRRGERLEAVRAAKERLEAAQRGADDACGAGPNGSVISRATSRTSAPAGSRTGRRRATPPTPTAPSRGQARRGSGSAATRRWRWTAGTG